MGFRSCLLILVVVYIQSQQTHGGTCGKKRQCCPQLKKDTSPPLLNLDFTSSDESVTLVNGATQDENGLRLLRAEDQYAILKNTADTRCLLTPSQCSNGLSISMRINIEYCEGRNGILSTVRTADQEGVRIVCEFNEILTYVVTGPKKYLGKQSAPLNRETRLTIVQDPECGISFYYDEEKQHMDHVYIQKVNAIAASDNVGLGLYYNNRLTDRTMEGTIADLMVWNRTLTTDEIKTMVSADQKK